MDRVKVSWTLGALSVGIVLAVSALPSTNWLLKNTVDSMRYGVDKDNWAPVPAAPKNLTDFRLLENDGEAKFIADQIDNGSSEEARQKLIRYAEEHPKDPEIWAETLTFLYRAPMHRRPKDVDPGQAHYWSHRPLEWSKYEKRRTEALQAAEQGLKLEPNNGYFAFAVADIAWGLGDRAKGTLALEAAARCTDFKDYHQAAAEARLGIMDRHYGYRGEVGRFYIYGGILYPEYASQRALSEEIARLPHDKHGLLLRVWMLQEASLSAERSTSLIGIVSAYGRAGVVLRDGRIPPDVPSLDSAQLADSLTSKAAQFESELAAAAIPVGKPTPTQIVARFAGLMKTSRSYISTLGDMATGMGPSFDWESVLVSALLAVALAFAIIGIGAVLSLLPRGALSALLPYGCAIGGTFSISGDHRSSVAAVLVVFAAARVQPDIRKHGHLCNLAALAAILSLNLMYGQVDTSTLMIAGVFSLAWAATALELKNWVILVLSLILLPAVAFIVLLAFVPDYHDHPHDYRWVTFGCLALIAIFPFRRFKAVATVPSLALAASLLLLAYVSNGLVQNSKLRSAVNSFANEGDIVRRDTGTAGRT